MSYAFETKRRNARASLDGELNLHVLGYILLRSGARHYYLKEEVCLKSGSKSHSLDARLASTLLRVCARTVVDKGLEENWQTSWPLQSLTALSADAEPD